MKRLLMLIPLVFLCCLGCQQGEKAAAADVEADIQAIKDIVADYEAGANSADIDRYLQHYADDAIDIYPNEPATFGKDAVRDRDRQMFNEITLQDIYTVQDIKVSGDLAVAHITLSAIVTINASGEHFDTNGNWILVFGKQPNDSWKINYSIWSDESLIRPQFEQKESL